MPKLKNNLVLIGMPGSGKSTLGKRLARRYGLDFLDTDHLLEQRYGESLQIMLNRHGMYHIRKLEQQLLCSFNINNSLIATGGSAVYSRVGMQHLQSQGRIVYLHISLPTLLQRVDNMANRGMLKPAHFTLPNVYRERLPLYQQWADITLSNNQPFIGWHLDAQFDSALADWIN